MLNNMVLFSTKLSTVQWLKWTAEQAFCCEQCSTELKLNRPFPSVCFHLLWSCFVLFIYCKLSRNDWLFQGKVHRLKSNNNQTHICLFRIKEIAASVPPAVRNFKELSLIVTYLLFIMRLLQMNPQCNHFLLINTFVSIGQPVADRELA